MAYIIIFSKILTKTDIEKRLSVPTVKKQCFLNFRDQHKAEFKVVDKNGEVWTFVCSTRKKKGDYPKPVLSKGWLQFVRCWKLAIGDEVIIYRNQDKAGKAKGYYMIEVIKRATQRSWVVSPSAQKHDADRTMAVASCSNVEEEPTIISHNTDQASYSNVEGESTMISHSTDQALTYDEIEGLHNQLVTDRVGLKFEFVSLKHEVQVIREPKFINFFELGSQDRRQKEQPSFPSLYHKVESPIALPMFKFL
ncbi:hypothetical protein REPUB_Repub04eG0014600 [Reevesia pubescens]